ncbi:MAG: sigma-70 family RNA polymerase sigma factor [candidate division Zixibacteria bacterium]|nr:sigma-70 family RNA polymerase sigma factor [candidate division Zixibacteria bacterium]MDH3936480.1 sigma-70 family RNA polymerase sigma factor [candidate division Zixibacteria bacterium]MDH4033698.1 sigma-70 family RNA polymerase sigma factor [candidate division Zixibacteria bacterium]
MNKTNRQLFEQVKLGHQPAWKELVARYEQAVMGVAMRCGLDRTDAEDCAQMSWLALYRNLNSIRDPDKLGGWLIRTTRRNGVRMAKRLALTSKYAESDGVMEMDQYSNEEVTKLELQVHLQYAINQLDDRCQKLLRALFFSPKGDSYSEIARRLDISLNSIGPFRYRCLEKLRRILKECGFL